MIARFLPIESPEPAGVVPADAVEAIASLLLAVVEGEDQRAVEAAERRDSTTRNSSREEASQ